MRDSGDILKFRKTNARSWTSIPPAASVTSFAPVRAVARVPRLPRPMIPVAASASPVARSDNWIHSRLQDAAACGAIIAQVQQVGCVILWPDGIRWFPPTKKLRPARRQRNRAEHFTHHRLDPFQKLAESLDASSST